MLKRRYKWMELRHREVYEPDPIHDIDCFSSEEGETQFLNGKNGECYYSRGEAIMDLERIDKIYPNRKEEYVLMEFWTKGVKE
jgi:hypothetical protein